MSEQLGPDPRQERAAELVHRARAGELGQDGTDLVALFGEAHRRAMDAQVVADDERMKREGLEREANALAAVLAEVLQVVATTGGLTSHQLDNIVYGVPHQARRRVLAYRARLQGFPGAQDQEGPLPAVPPKNAVLRERVRTIDAEPL